MVRVRFRSEIRKVHMRDFKIAQRMLQIVQMYKLYTKAVLATSCIAFFVGLLCVILTASVSTFSVSFADKVQQTV